MRSSLSVIIMAFRGFNTDIIAFVRFIGYLRLEIGIGMKGERRMGLGRVWEYSILG